MVCTLVGKILSPPPLKLILSIMVTSFLQTVMNTFSFRCFRMCQKARVYLFDHLINTCGKVKYTMQHLVP